MTTKQQFLIGCIIFSIGFDLLTNGNIDLKRIAKRVFYVTVACYIAFDSLNNN